MHHQPVAPTYPGTRHHRPPHITSLCLITLLTRTSTPVRATESPSNGPCHGRFDAATRVEYNFQAASFRFAALQGHHADRTARIQRRASHLQCDVFSHTKLDPTRPRKEIISISNQPSSAIAQRKGGIYILHRTKYIRTPSITTCTHSTAKPAATRNVHTYLAQQRHYAHARAVRGLFKKRNQSPSSRRQTYEEWKIPAATPTNSIAGRPFSPIVPLSRSPVSTTHHQLSRLEHIKTLVSSELLLDSPTYTQATKTLTAPAPTLISSQNKPHTPHAQSLHRAAHISAAPPTQQRYDTTPSIPRPTLAANENPDSAVHCHREAHRAPESPEKRHTNSPVSSHFTPTPRLAHPCC